ILAVIYADSCGNSTSRRLQAKVVPAESVHKKLPTKPGTLSPFYVYKNTLACCDIFLIINMLKKRMVF
ncbi:hypothetical protein, partial [Staphylococcus cohnii]|uniref:hypothetical protein n=1 Tax=Staphylococcus cohnii TaxID=29382 RepID=UPI001C711BE8